MSRADYSVDREDQWAFIRWRGAVKSAISGQRGQAFLKEMLIALDDLPAKKLIANHLHNTGEFCAIGSVGKKRGIDMHRLDPEDSDGIAKEFGIAQALVREIEFENDEGSFWHETPEERFNRIRNWVIKNIQATEPNSETTK